ncbi:monovalent cation/H(+) antiporter subunit G [Natribacillus halophilus]|uniref:Multisubunit sodium/proton antiporter, MrpG subunit n=1 Tax=Natribacillus halophilus TaxID=549003 RepID=A0A1G8JPR8_9BACI|nr:monovalent cation/H(+) antiporter subunit G [Natribacillus halophilus]SDI33175.1 multisubunit sodium/proton antiporter, MrpG subunit [Natribacillus halophilus]
MTAIEWIIVIFAGAGTIFSLFAAFGLLRFPDVYARLHATGKNATGGVIMSMFATFLFFLLQQDIFLGTLLLVILFVFLTTPIVTLTVSRAAYRRGVPLDDIAIVDELKEEYAKREETHTEKQEGN